MKESAISIRAYQFLDVSHFVPNPKNTARAVELFSEFEFLPTVFGELRLTDSTPAQIKRMRLFNDISKSKIDFESNRIEFEQLFDETTFDLSFVRTTIATFKKYQDLCADFLALNSSRYSIVCRIINTFESRNEFASNVNKYVFTGFYNDNHEKVSEFNARYCREFVARIGNSDELINFIKGVSADNCDPSAEDYVPTNVKLIYDINTSHKNSEARFSKDNFGEFLDHSLRFFESDFVIEKERTGWK